MINPDPTKNSLLAMPFPEADHNESKQDLFSPRVNFLID